MSKNSVSKSLPIKAILLAILCNVVFGSAIPVVKLGYAEFSIGSDIFSTFLFAGVRFFVSGIVIFLITAVKEKKVPVFHKENTLNIFTVAFTYTFLQYFFYYIAVSNLTGSRASIISATSAFVSVILAHFIYPDDKLNFTKISGTVIGFVGVVLACSTEKLNFEMSFLGDGFLFIAVICFVVGSVFNKKASATDSVFTVSAYNLLFGGLLLMIVGLTGYSGGITVSFKGILLLLHLIFVSTFGFVLWSYLLSKNPIGSLGVYAFVIPVTGGIISGLVLNEDVFNFKFLLALLLVSIGVVVVNYKK